MKKLEVKLWNLFFFTRRSEYFDLTVVGYTMEMDLMSHMALLNFYGMDWIL